MSLKDELNAIKDASNNEAAIKAKFNSPENVARITKAWIDSWVEIVLKNIEIEIKDKVKKGKYEKYGDHNLVHKEFTIYDENHPKTIYYNESAREKGLIGILTEDEFAIDKETLAYLKDNGIIDKQISIISGDALVLGNEYGGMPIKYLEGRRAGICLYVYGGRGIKFNYRCVDEKRSLGSDLKKLFNSNVSTSDKNTRIYESLTIGDVGKYIIDRFKKRAPAYGFKVDIYAKYLLNNSDRQKEKYIIYDLSQLMSEVDLGLFSDYTIPEFYLTIDFKVEF